MSTRPQLFLSGTRPSTRLTPFCMFFQCVYLLLQINNIIGQNYYPYSGAATKTYKHEFKVTLNFFSDSKNILFSFELIELVSTDTVMLGRCLCILGLLPKVRMS